MYVKITQLFITTNYLRNYKKDRLKDFHEYIHIVHCTLVHILNYVKIDNNKTEV